MSPPKSATSKAGKRNAPSANLEAPHPEGHHVEPGKPDTALGLERLLFFSDAVLAIAITLLVIDLKLPEGGCHARLRRPGNLMEMGGKFLSFFISFTVIGLYWLAHHRLFAYIRRYDATLLWLNLLFLLGITFLPFATGLLGSHIGLFLTRTIYAVTVAFIGLAETLVWQLSLGRPRARRRRRPDADPPFAGRIGLLFVLDLLGLCGPGLEVGSLGVS